MFLPVTRAWSNWLWQSQFNHIIINKKFTHTKPFKNTLTSLQSLFGTSKLFLACKVNRHLLNLSMEKVLDISYKIEARFSRIKKSSISANEYPLECGGGNPVISPWCSPTIVLPYQAEEHLFLTAFLVPRPT